ncbi:hypothetical protein [Acinetobacter haemolyticus]|uniref:hypothetical protein n=1 Tax=Acinetobacter haemolyticus TaxID=29430 RepID=UPI000CA194BA|nr:hypothetical protein [Acinetobacter haemolyticus]ATZ67862.1 hypothetical protein BSR56_11230 [Acinetobacter haemolyticus]
MKKSILTFTILIPLFATGCGNASNPQNANENATQEERTSNNLTADDLKIINKYNGYLESSLSENFPSLMEEILPEIGNISNKYEREKIQMNIYLVLNRYEDAYRLNEKQLAESPTSATRLTFKCQLLALLNKDKNQIVECHDNAAKQIKVELDKMSKSDPARVEGEFAYYLEMYKAGHLEYKNKMQKLISTLKDESLKIWFSTVYNIEVEALYKSGSAGVKAD